MRISDWLDEKEAEGTNVSQIEVPKDMFYDQAPDETVFFEEVNPCGFLCTQKHPFSKVERFGHWYYSSGQDQNADIHALKEKWWLFTKDEDLAIQTAKAHRE